jgi:peptidoglycan hydrolase CwlO-like protein
MARVQRGFAHILSRSAFLMSNVADLTNAAAALQSAQAQLASELSSHVQAVQGLESAYEAAKNNPDTRLAPTDQAALDNAVQQITDTTAQIAAATGQLQGVDTGIPATQSSTPPAPTP